MGSSTLNFPNKNELMSKKESQVIKTYGLWHPQTSYINWVVENNSSFPASVKLGAHMGLIGSLCSIIEGVCEYVLIENLISNSNLPIELDRTKLKLNVNSAQWSQYDSLFNKVFKNNLCFYVKKHKNNIDMMFKLRNSIVHGNKLQLKNTYTEEKINFEIVGGNYNLIYEFLKENDVISGEITSAFSDPSILFSDQVIKYFIEETISFVTKINESDLLKGFDKNIIQQHILIVLNGKSECPPK